MYATRSPGIPEITGHVWTARGAHRVNLGTGSMGVLSAVPTTFLQVWNYLR